MVSNSQGTSVSGGGQSTGGNGGAMGKGMDVRDSMPAPLVRWCGQVWPY